MKRISCFVAMIMLSVLFSNTAFAVSTPYDNDTTLDVLADTLMLVPNDDGTYVISNGSRSGSISVTKFDGTDVYADAVNSLYMRVNATAFIRAKSFQVDLESYQTLLNRSTGIEFSPRLLEIVTKIMNDVASGKIELNRPLVIYYPEEHEIETRGITSSTKTYIGYKGKQYYQELLSCSGNSLEFNVRMPKTKWSQYCENVFVAGVQTMMDGVINTATYDYWTLISIFTNFPSDSLSTTQAGEHTAKLFENKYTKITYFMRDGEYISSSVIDYAYDYSYENFINIPGIDFYSNGRTQHFSEKATGYDNADEYAYHAEVSGNYNNQITKYRYRNSTLELNTFVDSLF